MEGSRAAALGEADRDRIGEALRLADRLGGDTVTIPGGRRIADDILAYARSANVNHVVVGKADRSWVFERLNGSVVHDLVRRCGGIGVHVVPGEALAPETGKRRAVATTPARRGLRAVALRPRAARDRGRPRGGPASPNPTPASRMRTCSC